MPPGTARRVTCWGLDAACGEAGHLPRRHELVQVAGQRDGGGAGQGRRPFPEPAAGPQPVRQLVTSDDHAGWVSAIAAVLPGAAWQRCRRAMHVYCPAALADLLGQRVDPHERYAGQAAGGHAAQERQPPGAILAGGDVDAGDLPAPVRVDPVAIITTTCSPRAEIGPAMGLHPGPHHLRAGPTRRRSGHSTPRSTPRWRPSSRPRPPVSMTPARTSWPSPPSPQGVGPTTRSA
jgi:Transposase, Mutator family